VLLLAIFTELLEMKNHSLCPFGGRLYSGSSIGRLVMISFSAFTIMLCAFPAFVYAFLLLSTQHKTSVFKKAVTQSLAVTEFCVARQADGSQVTCAAIEA
jgi:hypothetical protein